MSEIAPRPVRIALVDSGIDPGHPGCRGYALQSGWHIDADGGAFAEPIPRDPLGHGTAVATTLWSVCPRAVVVPLRVFDAAGRSSVRALVAALRQIAMTDVAVVNCSLGFDDDFGASRQAQSLLKDAAKFLLDRGVRIVVPAALPCGRANALAAIGGLELVVADGNVPAAQPRLLSVGAGSFWFASPFPPAGVPGLPPSHVHGSSLAVARTSGMLANALSLRP